MYKDINGTEFRSLVEEAGDNAVLIDVRTPEECAEGIIPGARNINLMGHDFMEQISQMDKSKTYFMICRSGGRSGSACGAMSQTGFSNVYNLNGGMMSWDGEVQ
ncbi:MAG: rhodanese-like domain-containing protein [Salibacteraceae bacterium]